VKLYAELVNGSKGEVLFAGDIAQEVQRIRGDLGQATPAWIEATDGSWIQTSHIVRIYVDEDTPPPVG
jgi:hypothetical protein